MHPRFVWTLLFVGLFATFTGCGNPPECQRSQDCTTGKLCQQGTCAPDPTAQVTCSQDLDCPRNQRCQQGTCIPSTTPCKRDDECGKEHRCHKQICRLLSASCNSKEDCLPGQQCQNNQCLGTPNECGNDSDCLGKTKPICSDAYLCEWSCRSDTDCSTGQQCINHECNVEQKECQSDKDCAGKARPYCSTAGSCEWACRNNQDCKVREQCTEYVCKPREGICKKDTDCKTGQVCWREVCVQECDPKANPSSCSQGETCLPASLHVAFSGKGACMRTCNLNQSSCPPDFACFPPTDDKEPLFTQPHCFPILPRDGGTTQLGEMCVFEKPDGTLGQAACEGKKGLVCSHSEGRNYRCTQTCDPGKGFQNNPDCQPDEKCYRPDGLYRGTLSARGGLCFPTGKGEEGAQCTTLFPRHTTHCTGNLHCSNKTCRKACIPAKSDCSGSQTCVKDWQSPSGYSCLEQRGEEESCSTQRPCIKGLACRKGRCVKECSDDKDCQSNQGCVELEVRKPKTCLRRCARTKGFVVNADCARGFYCNQESYCQPLNPPFSSSLQGTRKQGETCLTSAPNLENCDVQQNLYCNVRKTPHVCEKLCDPYGGTLAHPDCGGAACIEDTQTGHLGGFCEPVGQSKRGESCTHPKACEKGLVCEGAVCVQACDSRKPGSCRTNEFCWRSRCLKNCDPQQGTTLNPACPTRTYCAKAHVIPKSHCKDLPKPPTGKRQLDQSCFFVSGKESERCDGSKGLYCHLDFSGLCRIGCDPRKGFSSNPSCQQNESCVVDPTFRSPLGGTCTTVCDPDNGIFTQTQCKIGSTCFANRYISPGMCITIPRLFGPQEQGEPCGKSLSSTFCNGNKELFCNGNSTGTCEVACNPRLTGQCKGDQICQENQWSFLGGQCVDTPSRKLGETCNTSERCITGLTCYQGACRKACDIKKGVSSNSICSQGELCVGVCIQPPSAPSGTRQEGTACSSREPCDGTKGLVCGPSQLCIRTCDPDKATPCKQGEVCRLYATSSTGGACVSDAKQGQPCNPNNPLQQCSVGLACTRGRANLPFLCTQRTQQRGELCDGTNPEGNPQQCMAGLTCWGNRCQSSCNPKQGTTSNPKCQNNGMCHPVTLSVDKGVCLP